MDIDRGIEKSNQDENPTTLVDNTTPLSVMMEVALKKAGSISLLAYHLGVNRQNIWCWKTRGKIGKTGRQLLVKYLLRGF
jgi:hypothetical protein